MAQTVVWSGEALSDIEGIAEFINRDSVYYAEQVVTRLLEAGESLAEQPARGRIVPEVGSPTTRELFIYSYRLLYEVKDAENEIHVLGVIHGKRLLESVERFQ